MSRQELQPHEWDWQFMVPSDVSVWEKAPPRHMGAPLSPSGGLLWKYNPEHQMKLV